MKDIIINKRNGLELGKQEIQSFVSQYSKGLVPDYQAASFLMAVYFRGMTPQETFYLTDAMLRSGISYDLKRFGRKCIDKHSTGGVGDKLSLICGPIVASLGVYVPMVCGRGLGHTGGTIDKLESIPGFKTALSRNMFHRTLDKCGLVFSSQTEEIAPADKKLYALRDVTGTVESIPLITSSIMSKKLATGARGIVFDVKVGRGAFMKDEKEALVLAKWLLQAARKFDRRCMALLTDMDEPLGFTAGNSLEVIESIEALRGNASGDILEISLEISAAMIYLAGLAANLEKARMLALHQIKSGKALSRFAETVRAQGGDPDVVSPEYRKWKKPKYVIDVTASRQGYISDVDACSVGELSCALGAGRQRLEDRIDASAGIMFFSKKGDKVGKGDITARIFTDKKDHHIFAKRLKKIIVISDRKPAAKKKILKEIA